MMSDGPVVTCTDVTATPGDSDVILPCSVRARPHVTSLYWTIGNETAVTDVTLGTNYITLVRVRHLLCCYFSFYRATRSGARTMRGICYDLVTGVCMSVHHKLVFYENG